MTELIAGQQPTQSLRLVRQLGAGGMGTVWVARHLGLDSDVAVKFITGEHARNAEVLGRFRREAAAASEVRSPHVVQVFDYGIASNGLPYIAMELLEGEDLAGRMARQRVVSAAEVAGVVVQVARALARAHEKKIVHRDIKPENIFLCDTGEDEAFVKVLDFGIAKIGGPSQFGGTATGAILGTPYFMSPEQVNDSKAIDHRSDLWSLGVVAYYAMTGVRPFDGETLVGVAMKICTGAIPPPSTHNPQLSPAIDAWVERACAKEPGARFQTAKAMADALVAAVGGRAVAQVMSKSASFEEADTQECRPSMMGALGIGSSAARSLPPAPAPSAAPPLAPYPPAARLGEEPTPKRPAMLATTTGPSSTSAPRADGLSESPEPARPSRAVRVLAIGAALGVLLGVGGLVLLRTSSSSGRSSARAALEDPREGPSAASSNERSASDEPKTTIDRSPEPSATGSAPRVGAAGTVVASSSVPRSAPSVAVTRPQALPPKSPVKAPAAPSGVAALVATSPAAAVVATSAAAAGRPTPTAKPDPLKMDIR